MLYNRFNGMEVLEKLLMGTIMKNLNILSFLAFLLVAVQAPIFSMQKQLLTDRSTGQNVKSIVNIDTAKNRARVLQRHSVINDPNANPLRAISHQVPVANDLKKIKKRKTLKKLKQKKE